MDPKPTILVPLYIWPISRSTWEPLYEANRISSHPNVTFLVVVNPNSGPGGKPLPGNDYVREVPSLNAFGNVITVGYVRIHYCERELSEVYDEIDTYAGWSAQNSAMRLKGILLDETPNHFLPERAEYLEALRQHIKSREGFGGDKVIVHNPGTPPDGELGESGPDVIITCEEPYQRFKGAEVQKRLKDLHYDRVKSGYMISGIPAEEIVQAVKELCRRGAYIFATDLVDDFYESFGKSWKEFVAAMAGMETDEIGENAEQAVEAGMNELNGEGPEEVVVEEKEEEAE